MVVYDMENFGSRISEFRKNKNMTQAELATKLGVTRSCIANWETGKREVEIIYWEVLGVIFSVSIEQLCGARVLHEQDETTIDLSKLSDKGRREVVAFYYKLLDTEKKDAFE